MILLILGVQVMMKPQPSSEEFKTSPEHHKLPNMTKSEITAQEALEGTGMIWDLCILIWS